METISFFNHHFYMTYQRLETPYTVPLEVAIHLYLNSMEQLIAILLRRLPVENIDT